MEKYVIREGKVEDAEKYLQYLNCVLKETDYLTTSPEEMGTSVVEQEQFIKKCSDTENFLFLVAEYKDEIVGNLIFRGGEKKRVKHIGEFGITITKNNWGHGLASKLIKEMLAWAEEGNVIKKINLRVREDNHRAIGLYKRNGFKKEGTISDFFYENDEYHSAVVMGMSIGTSCQYKVTHSHNIDPITVRDFYCTHSTWKVPVEVSAWEILIKNSQVFISIWDEDKIIGAARAITDTVRWATILDVLVHPDYRNNGIGTKLMKEILSSNEMNVRSISLCTSGSETFYEKFGFESRNDCCSNMIKTNMESEDSFILPV